MYNVKAYDSQCWMGICRLAVSVYWRFLQDAMQIVLLLHTDIHIWALIPNWWSLCSCYNIRYEPYGSHRRRLISHGATCIYFQFELQCIWTDRAIIRWMVGTWYHFQL